MPIYEYRCSSCGHELESLQKFADAPLTSCPACKGETLVKLVSAAGFHLKGSGWYATDFRGGSSPAKPAAARPAARRRAPGDTPYHHGDLHGALLQAAERVLERDGLAGHRRARDLRCGS